MSLYNIMFGDNPVADLLLAVVGLKRNDVERYRGVDVSEDGTQLEVYTRTGGGNRADYPQELMRHVPGWRRSVDDDYDSTYCTDYIDIPAEWRDDVASIRDPLGKGIRPEFGQHLLKTFKREPTQADIEHELYERERLAIGKLAGRLANGHTFVPSDDSAMREILRIAEANGGNLRYAWGILPLELEVRQNHRPYAGARDARDRDYITRAAVDVKYPWKIDRGYWEHVQARFGEEFPKSIAKMREGVSSLERGR